VATKKASKQARPKPETKPRAAPAKPRAKAKTKTQARKRATSPKRPAKAPARAPAPRRADYGAPVDGFFDKKPPALRAILVELRALVEQAAPRATATLKWGMPFYTLDGAMLCALAAHKAHVNLILAGPPGSFDDPEGRLSGGGKTGRHLKLTSVAELPRASVRRWLRAAVAVARAG
jgi:hypothetical protein